MGLGLTAATGTEAGYDHFQQILAQRMAQQQYADKLKQQDTENSFRQQGLDLQRQNTEAQQARWKVEDARAAQTQTQAQGNQLVDELSPGQSISENAGRILTASGRGDLQTQNPGYAFPGFLQSGPDVRDVNPGQQAGRVFTGTAAQQFQRSQAEAGAEQKRQADLYKAGEPDRKFAEFQRQYDYEVAHPKPNSNIDSSDAQAIADAIIEGKQPPTIQGLYKNAAPVKAYLAKQGYDLTTATLDWQATTKHLATMNGQQQNRMRQAVDNAYHSLDVIEDLSKQWDGGKFPALNRAQLAAAKNGLLGPQAQQIATNLEAQISDVTSELGNVYMGGNSPTDHALSLAGKNLSADWTKAQLASALNLARTNLKIRQNSMNNVGPAGASANNPYATQQPAGGGGTIRARDPQGVLHEAAAGTALPAGWTLEK